MGVDIGPVQREQQHTAETPVILKLSVKTTFEDFLTSRSTANPYPEKAVDGGLLVWSVYHPTTNPLIVIKYPSTGEIYDAQVPLAYEEKPGTPLSRQEVALRKKSDLLQKEEKTREEATAKTEDYKRWADAAGHHSKLGKFYWRKYSELSDRFNQLAETDSRGERTTEDSIEPSTIGGRGKWIPIEEYWDSISENLIRGEAARGIDFNGIVTRSIVAQPGEIEARAEQYRTLADAETFGSRRERFYRKRHVEYAESTARESTFLPPPDTFLNMFAELTELAQQGDWRSVLAISTYGLSLGRYEINGVKYSSDDIGLFDYKEEFAMDVFPEIYFSSDVDKIVSTALSQDREHYRDYNARMSDVSGLLIGLLSNTLVLQSVKMASHQEPQEIQNKLNTYANMIKEEQMYFHTRLLQAEKVLATYCGIENANLLSGFNSFLSSHNLPLIELS